MSWPWSQWKRQYLSLDLLLGSPFNLPCHIKVVSSLIYIRTWSIKAVSKVKLANLPVGGLECLSSRRSPVLVIFRPLSCWASSYLSLFLGFSSWASSVSFAFVLISKVWRPLFIFLHLYFGPCSRDVGIYFPALCACIVHDVCIYIPARPLWCDCHNSCHLRQVMPNFRHESKVTYRQIFVVEIWHFARMP